MPAIVLNSSSPSLSLEWDKSITPKPGLSFAIDVEATGMVPGNTYDVAISSLPAFISSTPSPISLDDVLTSDQCVLPVDDPVA